ncbi:Uncharacterised protein [Vibrio cholerae]|nr:Uncharacterised protein [Vibrio cholerae]
MMRLEPTGVGGDHNINRKIVRLQIFMLTF